MKKVLFVLLVITLIFAPTAMAETVKSNPVTTSVGNPPTGPTGNSSGSDSEVLSWDQKINEALQVGSVWAGYYNRMTTPISNGSYTTPSRQGLDQGTGPTGLYWCTNSVIDSYNLSGKKGLGLEHQAVVSMDAYWQTAPGYTYVSYLNSSDKKDSLSRVKPGYAIFFESSPGVHTSHEHVAIIKSININSRGDGTIETLDSNSSTKGGKYPVDQYIVKGTPYSLVGFGG